MQTHKEKWALHEMIMCSSLLHWDQVFVSPSFSLRVAWRLFQYTPESLRNPKQPMIPHKIIIRSTRSRVTSGDRRESQKDIRRNHHHNHLRREQHHHYSHRSMSNEKHQPVIRDDDGGTCRQKHHLFLQTRQRRREKSTHTKNHRSTR